MTTGKPTPPQRSRGSWLAILVAVVTMLAGSATLLLLPIGWLGVAIVFGGGFFVLVIGFHYLVWGYWIGRVLRRQQEEWADVDNSDQ